MTISGRRPVVLGIAGPTCSGKTTLSSHLRQVFPSAKVIGLDAFHNARSHVQTFASGRRWVNWETTVGVDYPALIQALNRAIESSTQTGNPLVIVEGFLILEHPQLVSMLDKVIVLEVSKGECYRRRITRRADILTDYLAPGEKQPPVEDWLEAYFEEVVWPAAITYSAKLAPRRDVDPEGLLRETHVPNAYAVSGEMDAQTLCREIARVVSSDIASRAVAAGA